MIDVKEEDARLLLGALDAGEAVLILGAGASATSKLANGEPVMQAGKLAEVIAQKVGLKYDGETLPDVLGAAIGKRMSEAQFHAILTKEYTGVIPSDDLKQAFQYTWRRVYSWNIDDAVENLKSGVQKRRYYNGMIDKVAVVSGLEYLQFIHLHGDALKPEHGFIFRTSEYTSRLIADRHDWYRNLATDYISFTPIFVGSRLKEPILEAELDRARPANGEGLGMAFLVTPDSFSDVMRENFASRNIVLIQATFGEFIEWIKSQSKTVSPVDIAKNTNAFANELGSSFDVNAADMDTAQYIVLHTWKALKADSEALRGLELEKAARGFLEGNPPTWKLAASQVPVWLKGTEDLYAAFLQSVEKRDRVFAVHGQSGSGKTTAILQSLARYLRENDKAVVYELRGDVRSLRDSLGLIHRLHKGSHVIVYIGDAFIYGDSLGEDITSVPSGSMTVVTGARSGEWREHISRRLGDIYSDFTYQRFVAADHQPLIQRLLQYVPAPRFKRMTPEQRLNKIRSSNQQLLIALKETTESDKFTAVITKEFQGLPDDACKSVVLMVGIATIARTGLSEAAAREAYHHLGYDRSFTAAMAALEGIVSVGYNGRLYARHESYVRHLVENVGEFRSVVNAEIEVLRTFTKYDTPIVKNVGRQDSLLFKFLMNHNFNADLARRRNDMDEGLRLYEEFEVPFQLDGHYWLQYGQYLVEMGLVERALGVLNKSIQAYPGNLYAAHAYADVQLRVAAERSNYDAVTIELIGDAVKTLEQQHAQASWESDQYPIVTLSERHVGALIKHGQTAQARTAAQRYFRQVDDLARRNGAEPLQLVREKLAHYVTFGQWFEGLRPRGQKRNAGPRRRARKPR